MKSYDVLPCDLQPRKLETPGDSPAAVNEDPLGAGWLARVRLEKPEELKALMSYDAYQQSLKE